MGLSSICDTRDDVYDGRRAAGSDSVALMRKYDTYSVLNVITYILSAVIRAVE